MGANANTHGALTQGSGFFVLPTTRAVKCNARATRRFLDKG